MNWQPLRAWRLRGESAPELDRKRRGSAKSAGRIWLTKRELVELY